MSKKPKTDETVGQALIEQNKTVIALLETIKAQGAELIKQNEKKLEKAEVLISLQTGQAILKGGDKTNPYEKTEKMFPDHLREMLDLSTEGNEWVARPRRFLGRDNFGMIAAVVRQLGGRYVSAGKNSHFRGPLSA